MTPELTYLAYSAALTAVLWVPYILGIVITKGMIQPSYYGDPTPPAVPAWVKRCNRAHVNAVESLAPFAVMVIIAHLAKVSNDATVLWTMVFFFARVVHAVIFWLGIPYLRTVAFLAGLVATIAIFLEILGAAPAT